MNTNLIETEYLKIKIEKMSIQCSRIKSLSKILEGLIADNAYEISEGDKHVMSIILKQNILNLGKQFEKLEKALKI